MTADGHEVPDLGRNGTYVVVRQIAQNVPKLWNYLDQATQDATDKSCPVEREKLASKLIGRWPSGAPLVDNPKNDDPRQSARNDFLYQSIDPGGFSCPLGAHIRRTNPRDTLGTDPVESLKLTKRHRLIRRGRSYGPRMVDPLASDTQERGLMFMSINANIERQFEFIQQTWSTARLFHGLDGEVDPILGRGGKGGRLTIPTEEGPLLLSGFQDFVTVRGGDYFFVPGRRALRYLAGDWSTHRAWNVELVAPRPLAEDAAYEATLESAGAHPPSPRPAWDAIH